MKISLGEGLFDWVVFSVMLIKTPGFTNHKFYHAHCRTVIWWFLSIQVTA